MLVPVRQHFQYDAAQNYVKSLKVHFTTNKDNASRFGYSQKN
jgi:hypothetical protein